MIARLALLSLIAVAAWGAEQTLTVNAAWARATAPSATNGAVFLTLVNDSDAEVRITAARSPASATAELHGHRKTDAGTVQMYELDALVVPAKGKAELAPGGLHVMLMGLTAPLKEGEAVELELTVAGQEAPLKLSAAIQGIAAMGPPAAEGGCDCCHTE